MNDFLSGLHLLNRTDAFPGPQRHCVNSTCGRSVGYERRKSERRNPAAIEAAPLPDHIRDESFGSSYARAQHPVGSMRPSDREGLGDYRVLVSGSDQSFDVFPVCAALLRCQEPSSNPHTVCSRRKGPRHLLARSYPTGSYDRDINRSFKFSEEG